ncbi:uncharacterized protein EI97DRAFT_77440 [Westerdykella ornata]|uniref:CCHC-type domain-containing protein n=1 Tax=Westerdykella ornata TaxID=318751 RepID=A0A6A6JKV1_WESOR|nr:uncharacterized protein EI97DRAFT_77440 [Westerdykella ornata]KAF2275519.1 hypothetical protein EI97DRAFT_77440 [Westerdykella ornata]
MSYPTERNPAPDMPEKPLRGSGAKRQYLTVAQLAKLKTGPRVNILVGPQDDQYIAVEGAYANVLSHYSELAKRTLSGYGVTRLWIPNASKSMISWIYRYMLAGEKDPPDAKFEQHDLASLVSLWCHAKALDYKELTEKTFKRLRHVISTVGVFDVGVVQQVLSTISELRGAIVDAVVYDLTNWVGACDYGYVHQIYHLEGMTALIDAAMEKELRRLVERSEWYYGQPHIKRQIEWMVRHRSNQLKAQNHLGKPISGVPTMREDVHRIKNTAVRRPKQNDMPAIHGVPGMARTQSGKIPSAGVVSTSKTVNKTTRQAKACFNCGSFEHLVRRCNVASAVAADKPAKLSTDHHTAIPPTTESKNRGATKLAEMIEITLSQMRSTKSEPRPKACYTCGSLEHLARRCNETATQAKHKPSDPSTVNGASVIPVRAANDVPLRQPLDSEKPIRCRKCRSIGHIARHCDVVPTMAANKAGDASDANGGPRFTERRPVICYNCEQVGHIARNCHGGRRHESSKAVPAAASKPPTANGHLHKTPFRGRNRNFRREKSDKPSFAPDYVEIAGNGEGITTCDYEVRPGQVTRTGLVV